MLLVLGTRTRKKLIRVPPLRWRDSQRRNMDGSSPSVCILPAAVENLPSQTSTDSFENNVFARERLKDLRDWSSQTSTDLLKQIPLVRERMKDLRDNPARPQPTHSNNTRKSVPGTKDVRHDRHAPTLLRIGSSFPPVSRNDQFHLCRGCVCPNVCHFGRKHKARLILLS